MRGSLSMTGSQIQKLLLSRPVPVYGLCAIDLARESPRCGGLPASTKQQTLSPRHPRLSVHISFMAYLLVRNTSRLPVPGSLNLTWRRGVAKFFARVIAGLIAALGERQAILIGHGWGALLSLDYLLELAQVRGYRRVSLETGTGPSFDPAVALYHKRGFVEGETFGDYKATIF